MARILKVGLVLSLFALALPCAAQLTIKPTGSLRVFGDSTLHQWDTTATVVNVSFTFADGAPKSLPDAIKASAIKSMEIRIPVREMKSGEKGLDKNLRKTLMEDKFPDIVYTLSKYELGKTDVGTMSAKTTGDLTITGKTKSISMDLELRPGPDGIAVKGSYSLKMSEYGIKPPTLMLGAIKVRDPITIRFDLVLKTGA